MSGERWQRLVLLVGWKAACANLPMWTKRVQLRTLRIWQRRILRSAHRRPAVLGLTQTRVHSPVIHRIGCCLPAHAIPSFSACAQLTKRPVPVGLKCSTVGHAIIVVRGLPHVSASVVPGKPEVSELPEVCLCTWVMMIGVVYVLVRLRWPCTAYVGCCRRSMAELHPQQGSCT